MYIHSLITFFCLQLQVNSYVTPRNFRSSSTRMAIFEGNPIGKFIWDGVWKLSFLKPGKSGQSPTTFGDAALVLKSNILQLYGNESSVDGAPLAVGEIEGLLEGSLFLGLKEYYEKVNSMTQVTTLLIIIYELFHANILLLN